ncbi:mechanosensitive ion channel family protein [Halobacterium bonnevillei]|uniref:Mechanosensitive ion channel n=1 Tax=Halobacterium bonnevillei TaxID=2692200 RepID=A0A6B0SI71_9EURY|nr:mechanosensitive ion channel family protein [Halobacterium bonnevillei]MXR21378.1 mechanosensitive ion channel [Halobacterium bonnevillei]
MPFESIASETYFGSTLLEYVLFFAVLGAGALLGRSLSFVYRRRLQVKAEATETEVDDIILHSLGGPIVLLGVIFGVAVGREFLTPVEPLQSVLNASIEIPVVVSIAWIAVRLTDGFIDTYVMEYAEETESKLDDELVPIASRITNIAIVSIAGIVILDSVGYDVTAIIASLGVGGIAVAFASRKTMADVFGGAHILSTKPFLVGDVVDVNGTAGTVEEIGLRTTRIRDFDGRTVTIPNSDIANAEVTNITSEPSRRVKTFVGLNYDTTPSEMDAAIALAAETARGVDGVDSEQTGAWFWEYGDSAMQIRLDYFITDLRRWKAIRDEVNRSIQRAFADAGFDMAFPTRTVRIEQGADTLTEPVGASAETERTG